MFGKDVDEHTVCVHVYGILDYFYVLKSAISFKFKSAKALYRAYQARGIDVVSVEEVKKQPLYYYNGAQSVSMYKIKVMNNKTGLTTKWAQMMLEKDCNLDNENNTAFFDSWQRSILEKFCTDFYIDPCGWIGIKHAKLIKRNSSKLTTCHTEALLVNPIQQNFVGASNTTEENGDNDDVVDKKDAVGIVNQVILGFDLECANLVSDTQMVQAAFDPIIQISVAVNTLFDDDDDNDKSEKRKNTIKDNVVFCLKKTADLDEVDADDKIRILSFARERDLLQAFIDYVALIDPDVITGYNINGFDLPYLWTRCDIAGLKSELTQSFSRHREIGAWLHCKRNYDQGNFKTHFKVSAPGRLICDCIVLVRDFLGVRLDDYRLNTVAASLLQPGNENQKEDMPYEEIPRIFRGGDPRELAKVARYCMKDSQLVMRILRATNGIQNLCETAKAVGLDPFTILYHGQQAMCLSAIARQIRDAGSWFAIPANVKPYKKTSKYEGAVVLDPKPGLYRDSVAVLDFASMYPSIIRGWNICYTTLTTEDEIEANNWRENEDFVRVPDIPNGLYVTPKHRKSLLASIVELLSEYRKQAKQGMKTNPPGSVAYVLADCRQQAFKRTSNSIYGLCGTNVGALLPCVINAAAITAFGRMMLYKTKHIVETNSHHAQVIYGDTDSVFVHFTDGSMTIDDAIRTGTDLAALVTKKLARSPVCLEFENVFARMILVGKKQYMSYLHTGKLMVKGIAAKKRDRPKLFRTLLSKVIHLTLVEDNWPEAAKLVKSIIAKILQDGGRCKDIPAHEFAKTVAISKHVSEYQGTVPMHANLAERMLKAGDPAAPAVGDRLPIVVCKDPTRPIQEKVSHRGFHPKDVCDKRPIDIKYYISEIQKLLETYFWCMYTDGKVGLRRELFPVQKSTILDYFKGCSAKRQHQSISSSNDDDDDDSIKMKRQRTNTTTGAGVR